MKKQIPIVLLLLFAGLGVTAQSVDKTVEKIDKTYSEISEKARLCETDDEQGEFGGLVMNEFTVNTRKHQWRAVGIYGQTYRFFYKGVENDERRLYPDELVLVRSERRVSNRTYNEEFLFSAKGDLLLYRQRSENDESVPASRAIYFLGLRPLRIIEDGKTRDRPSTADLKNITEIKRSATRLKELFVRSINL